MVMSSNTSSTIDAWSCRKIHHLPSMHGNVIWYITYHRCKIMSYDTSTVIDAWSCHLMQHLRSCHVMHHLHLIHGHVIWYITYHRCMVISYDASPTIDAWSCHIIRRCMVMSYDTLPSIDARQCHLTHHLPSMQDNVLWCNTYHRCIFIASDTSLTFMSCDKSPTIDAYDGSDIWNFEYMYIMMVLWLYLCI